jgi:uncharacterized repeat protein (TIGR02059 family)
MSHLKKDLLILLLLSFCLSLSATTYYISPNGNDLNNGDISHPFATLNKVWTVISAGDIVYLRGGTYLFPTSQELKGKSGTATNPIMIWAYPGEIPIITKSSSWKYFNSSGIYFEGNYFHWKGIEISGFKQIDEEIMIGFRTANSNHNIFELLNCNNNGRGFELTYGCDDNLILNCDFHHNYDPLSADSYGNADGIALNPDLGSTNTIKGCRSWNNSDDGYDIFRCDGMIILDSCWAWSNGYREDRTTKGGDGWGFKGGVTNTDMGSVHLRTFTNCLAFHNRLGGFGQNEARCIFWMFNNIAYHNNDGGGYFLGFWFDSYGGTGYSHVARNNIAYANQNTKGVDALWSNETTEDHNSWDGGVSVNDADFVSVDASGTDSPRQQDGSLPNLNFLKLTAGSDLIDTGVDVGLPYDNKAPDLGAFEFQSGLPAPSPVFISSVVENATPTIIGVTYDLTLTNIIPSTSDFSVKVNSVARTVNSVSISGTKVLLTLASPVIYGDLVTFSYTRPSTNPLQTASGGLVATLSAQTVINNVSLPIPLYVSSVIQNATPNTLVITYSLSLAILVPSSSAFGIKVNSLARTVNTVSISGTKVILTLSSPVVYGDVITVSYTKPATNPIQTSSGGLAATLSAQTVLNNVNPGTSPIYVSSSIENNSPTILEINYNLSLANIVPAVSSFTVIVNSLSRSVNTVSISGTKVLLTLSSQVVYGDVLTISYTKPATNPIQTSSGGQATTLSAQTVANNINPGSTPVYVSSGIENTTPTILEMTYNLSLVNIVPNPSAFTITVNSLPKSINMVSISGTKVLLTLASPVIYGDIVTVGYTKPSSNPLQTASGAQAASISAQLVTNKLSNPAILGYVNSAIGNTYPNLLEINYNLTLANVLPVVTSFNVRVNSVSRNVNSVSISGASIILTLATEVLYGDVITVSYTKPASNPLQSTSGLQAATMSAQSVTNKVNPVGPVYVSSAVENITPSILEITYNETLDLTIPSVSAFIVMVNGVKREVISVSISGSKVLLTLSSPVNYGDILTVSYIKPASNQLKKATGETAVSFSFPQPVTNKLVNKSIKNVNISLYPNPAKEFINVSIKEISSVPQMLRIFDLTGKLYLESKLNSASNNQILISIKPGIYVVQVVSGTVINFSQKLIITNN